MDASESKAEAERCAGLGEALNSRTATNSHLKMAQTTHMLTAKGGYRSLPPAPPERPEQMPSRKRRTYMNRSISPDRTATSSTIASCPTLPELSEPHRRSVKQTTNRPQADAKQPINQIQIEVAKQDAQKRGETRKPPATKKRNSQQRPATAPSRKRDPQQRRPPENRMSNVAA